MIHLIFFLIFLVIVTSSVSSSSSPLSCKQESGGFSSNLPYPFGLGEKSEIKLNCSKIGEIKIGEFVVKNVTSNQILIDFPANCNRSFDKLNNLYGKNFGVSSRNSLLLQGCQSPSSKCLPSSLLENRLGSQSCNISGLSSNITCYIDESGVEFLDIEKVGNNCSTLLSSVVVDAGNKKVDNNSGTDVALNFNTLELGVVDGIVYIN
ncbi:hypothetical protein Leryth_027361 [Lithospermum erythrorhizon]|nr:hypothetical protein Leryth_027361 [Lithospermum erythrorhizon]